jgi:hypothetical protein
MADAIVSKPRRRTWRVINRPEQIAVTLVDDPRYHRFASAAVADAIAAKAFAELLGLMPAKVESQEESATETA